MRVLSWNIQSIASGEEAITERILGYEADVITLQEYRHGEKGERLSQRLAAAGFKSFIPADAGRALCTVVYARIEFELRNPPAGFPTPSLYWIEARSEGVNISALHIPPVGQRLRAIYWEQAVDRCRAVGSGLHILIGDLNTTRHFIDEERRTIAGNEYLVALEDAGWREAVRSFQSGRLPGSWVSHHGNEFRVDQAWLSPGLLPALTAASLDHSVRKQRLSDHSALIVDLDNEALSAARSAMPVL